MNNQKVRQGNEIGTLVLTNGKDREVLVPSISYEDSLSWPTGKKDPRKPGWDVAWVDADGVIGVWPMWYPDAPDLTEQQLEYRSFYELTFNVWDPEEFPLLKAMRVMTDSLSNPGQSAPGTPAKYTIETWRIIEKGLATLTAMEFSEFVWGPHGLPVGHWDNMPEVKEFHMSWN
jgi:hypothetical protein